MNTKRILSLILSASLLVAAVASFSSCKKKECEHTFAAEWSTDATNHWHAATCEHTDQKKDAAAHADTNKDAKCDTCAYAMPTQGGSGTGTGTTKPKPVPATPVIYNIVVVNSKGEPVQDVKIKLIDLENTYGDGVALKDTDAEGKVSFEVLPKKGWNAQVVEAPAGYASEVVNTQVAGADTEDTADDVYIDFVKQYETVAGDVITITLVDAPIEETPEQTPEQTPETDPEQTPETDPEQTPAE